MKEQKEKELALLLILLMASFALRMVRLNSGLWYDEIHTLNRFVLLPWSQVFTTMTVPNNHILYTLLAKLSLVIFGEKEWSLRLPAMLLGGITPPACCLVFRKRVKIMPALVAGVFLAVSFWSVWFSQDARGYSAYILCAVLSQALFLDWAASGKKSAAAWYLLCSVAGCYFYFYTGFIIIAEAAWGFGQWLLQREKFSPAIFILPAAAFLVSAGLYAPGMADMANYMNREAHDVGGHWLNPAFIKELVMMLAGTRFLVWAILLFLVFLAGTVRLWRQWAGFCWLNLTAAVLVLAFTWAGHVFIYPRFLAFLIPFYFLAVASSINWLAGAVAKKLPWLKAGIIQAALAAIVCGFLAYSLGKYYEQGKQGFKQAAQYIRGKFPREIVLSYGLASQEFLYYDPSAIAWPGGRLMEPVDLVGHLVVASHPWSWSPENIVVMRQYCHLDQKWPSAGYPENNVYLFRCFEK